MVTTDSYSEAIGKKSLERFYSMLELVPEGVVVHNEQSAIVALNNTASQLLGFPKDQILGKTVHFFADFIRDRDGKPYEVESHPVFEVLRNDQSMFNELVRFQPKDGVDTILDISCFSLQNETSTLIVSFFNQVDDCNLAKPLSEEDGVFLKKYETFNSLIWYFSEAKKYSELGHWVYEAKTQSFSWSDEVYRILKLTKDTFSPSLDNFLALLPQQDKSSFQLTFQNSINTQLPFHFQHRIILQDGSEALLIESGFHQYDYKGNHLRSFGTLSDITRQFSKEFQIQKYLDMVDEQIIMTRTDLTGRIVEVSNFFCKISGYSREELIGKSHSIIRHPQTPKSIFKDLWQTIRSGVTWKGEIKNLRKDGVCYWVDSQISPDYDHFGRHVGYVSVRADITAQKQLESASFQDEMTGLFNRRYYNQQLHIELQRAKRNQDWLCFLMIDADHFKKYNDTYGHQKGDWVLIEIAKVMKSVFKRTQDLCFRLGGEEFAVLFEVKNPDDALIMAEQLRFVLYEKAIEHTGNQPYNRVTASLGALLMDPKANYVEEEIYKYTDEALYRAKSLGRNRVEFVTDSEVELF